MTVVGGVAVVGEELAAGGGGKREGNEFCVEGGGTGGGGATGRGGNAIGEVMSIGTLGGLMIVGGTAAMGAFGRRKIGKKG